MLISVHLAKERLHLPAGSVTSHNAPSPVNLQTTMYEEHALLLLFEEIRKVLLDFTMVAYWKIYFKL